MDKIKRKPPRKKKITLTVDHTEEMVKSPSQSSPDQMSNTIMDTQDNNENDKGEGQNSYSMSATKSKRRKYNTAPMEHLLEINAPEDDEVIEAFTEAFLISLRQKVEYKNPGLYSTFLHFISECNPNGTSDEGIFKKVEEMLKDFPDVAREFGGLRSLEAAFSTGNFFQFQEIHAQINFLQLLEKWTVYCPQLKTKIIQRLKNLQDTDLTDTKVLDIMQPFFSQTQEPILIDAFKALFPSIFRPQTNLLDAEFEEIDLDTEEYKLDLQGQNHFPIAEIEIDSFETVRLPEEKQVIATNTCPCTCHEDAAKVHFSTRAKHCHKCCLRFQDGKLYLHSGRVMKPVSITFSSPVLAKQILTPLYVPVKTTQRPNTNALTNVKKV